MSNIEITEEDIEILMSQTNINRDLAKELLIKNKGDIVECIVKLEKNENVESETQENTNDDKVEEEVKLDQKNLRDYRKIVDNKDVIYNKKSEEKEERKRKQKLIQERQEKGESIDDLVEKHLSTEELYYLKNKGNLTSIRVL
jgi:hypothetical protein